MHNLLPRPERPVHLCVSSGRAAAVECEALVCVPALPAEAPVRVLRVVPHLDALHVGLRLQCIAEDCGSQG